MRKKKFSIKTYFDELFRDERRRKPFLVSVIVFVVVFAGLTSYRHAAEEKPDDVIIAGSAYVNAEDNVAMNGSGQVIQWEDEIPLAENPENNVNDVSTVTEISGSDNTSDATDAKGQTAIFVDVGGAVRFNGLFALPAGSRIADAIDAAGGLTEEANVKYLNRATILLDGDRLYVPTETEVLEGTAPPSAGQITHGSIPVADASTGGTKTDTAQNLININTASSEELQTLNGVGPATAQKIIDYRTSKGGFKQIEDIMNVSGIGAKTFEKFCKYIAI